jgi:hypothetical protein
MEGGGWRVELKSQTNSNTQFNKNIQHIHINMDMLWNIYYMYNVIKKEL